MIGSADTAERRKAASGIVLPGAGHREDDGLRFGEEDRLRRVAELGSDGSRDQKAGMGLVVVEVVGGDRFAHRVDGLLAQVRRQAQELAGARADRLVLQRDDAAITHAEAVGEQVACRR